MPYKLRLLTGLTAGYVLGARAGRARYDQIATSVRGLLDQPAVQETAGVLQGQVAGLASTARQTVTSRLGRSSPAPLPDAVPPADPYTDPYADPTPAAGGFGTDPLGGRDPLTGL